MDKKSVLCLGRHALPGLPAPGVRPAARGGRREEESEDLEQEESDDLFPHRTNRSTLPTAIDVQARTRKDAAIYLPTERRSRIRQRSEQGRQQSLACIGLLLQ